MSNSPTQNNRSLLLPYALPYFAYVLPGVVLGAEEQRELAYLVRIVLTAAALAWGWRYYVLRVAPGTWAGSVGMGVAAGLLGTALWIGLLTPFVGQGGEAWTERAWGLRTVAAASLPPLFEELLLRGWVLGVAGQIFAARGAGAADPFGEAMEKRSIAELAPGAWTWAGVALSTLLFTLGHAQVEWVAAIAYGLLMCGLWIVRRDLLSCITAHAVTNLALAFYVRETGQWTLW